MTGVSCLWFRLTNVTIYYVSSLWAEAETHELLVTALDVHACTVCVCIYGRMLARAPWRLSTLDSAVRCAQRNFSRTLLYHNNLQPESQRFPHLLV